MTRLGSDIIEGQPADPAGRTSKTVQCKIRAQPCHWPSMLAIVTGRPIEADNIRSISPR